MNRQSLWSVSCSCIPTVESHSLQCPGRQLGDRDFDRCRAHVCHIRDIGDANVRYAEPIISEEDSPEIELPIYDALEHHGILPIKQLQSYRCVDPMKCSVFPRTIGPDIVRLELKAFLTDYTRIHIIPLPSLRVLILDIPHTFSQVGASGTISFRPAPGTLANLEVFHCSKQIDLPNEVLQMVLSSSALRDLELASSEDVALCIRTMPTKPAFQLHRLAITSRAESRNIQRCSGISTPLPCERSSLSIPVPVRCFYKR